MNFPKSANEVTESQPIRTSILSAIDTLDQALRTADSDGDELIAFATRYPDLIDSIFPTCKTADGVHPAYPGNYNADTQKLTLKGLEQLVEASLNSTRYPILDGYLSDDPNRKDKSGLNTLGHAINGTITGACWKHRDRKTLSFDFDCNVFRDTDLPESVQEWIVERYSSAVTSRGNRNRLAMTFRQSEELREYLKEIAPKTKVVWIAPEGEGKLEISVSAGASQNFWGEHKKMPYYQVLFPEVMGELSVADFKELIAALEAAGWTRQKQGDSDDNGYAVDDLLFLPEYAGLIDAIRQIRNLYPKATISALDLLTGHSKSIINGEVRLRS